MLMSWISGWGLKWGNTDGWVCSMERRCGAGLFVFENICRVVWRGRGGRGIMEIIFFFEFFNLVKELSLFPIFRCFNFERCRFRSKEGRASLNISKRQTPSFHPGLLGDICSPQLLHILEGGIEHADSEREKLIPFLLLLRTSSVSRPAQYSIYRNGAAAPN